MRKTIVVAALMLILLIGGVAANAPRTVDGEDSGSSNENSHEVITLESSFQSDNASENVEKARDIHIENRLNQSRTVGMNVTYNDVPACRDMEPPCGMPIQVIDVLQRTVTVPAHGEVVLSNVARRKGTYDIAVTSDNETGEAFEWRISESHHDAKVSVTDTGIHVTQAVESGPAPRPAPEDEYTFETSSGTLTVSKTNSACLSGNEEGQITGTQVNDVGERYSIGIGGYVTGDTPCDVLVPEISEEGDRIILNIRTRSGTEPCSQCLGKLHYHIGGNLDEEFRLKIQHDGETMKTVERPATRNGMLSSLQQFLSRLWPF